MIFKSEDCVFCRIANKEHPANIIYEDEKICSFLDIDPINEGHILIVPKKHYLDIDEVDNETAIAIMKLSASLVKVIKEVFGPDGYSIMQNGGVFNDVGHYHMHVFPRYKGDGFGWIYRNNNNVTTDLTIVKSRINSVLQQYIKDF